MPLKCHSGLLSRPRRALPRSRAEAADPTAVCSRMPSLWLCAFTTPHPSGQETSVSASFCVQPQDPPGLASPAPFIYHARISRSPLTSPPSRASVQRMLRNCPSPEPVPSPRRVCLPAGRSAWPKETRSSLGSSNSDRGFSGKGAPRAKTRSSGAHWEKVSALNLRPEKISFRRHKKQTQKEKAW